MIHNSPGEGASPNEKRAENSERVLKLREEGDFVAVLHMVKKDIQKVKEEIILSISATEPRIDLNKVTTLFKRVEANIENHQNCVIHTFNNKATVLSLSENCQDATKNTQVVTADQSLEVHEKHVSKLATNQRARGEQFPGIVNFKYIINPGLSKNRHDLYDTRGLQMPSRHKLASKKRLSPNRIKLRTRFAYPAKMYSQSSNESIVELQRCLVADDPRKGVLSLSKRNLFPSHPKLNIDPHPVQQKQIILQVNRRQQAFGVADSKAGCKPSFSKFNAQDGETPSPNEKRRQSIPAIENDQMVSQDMSPMSTRLCNSGAGISSWPSSTLMQSNADLAFCGNKHTFVIQNGDTRAESQDFIRFKQYYCFSWRSIRDLLKKLEKLLLEYSVPLAYIDGDKLSDLALCFEAGPVLPNKKDFLACIINASDVGRIILIPGRRYIAADGQERAAMKIQATYRCHRLHSRYLQYRRQKWAAGILALTWIMRCKMAMIRRQLKETRLLELQAFRASRTRLEAKWPALQSSKRVIIHIPSLGYCTSVRESVDNIASIQNAQVARICDIRDLNVDVIYVCGVQFSDELSYYYRRLVAIMAEVAGQNFDDAMNRLKFVTPECFDKFPAHKLCLSTLLKYSPKSLKRIRNMIAGKEAYIVPGVMHSDDLFISSYLGVPILGTEPEIVQMYSSKSGARRIFHSAKVNVPPGEADVYNVLQLKESLARLVTENISCRRWLFKINNQFNGRGTAFCDVASHLSCYQHALREAERYGSSWSQRWANESTYCLVLKEIDAIIDTSVIIDQASYKCWELFLKDFLRHGGLIEACPPAHSVTALTANLLIDPTGEIQLLSTSDQIHSNSPYQCWGHSLPQASCEATALSQSALAIARACKDRGIVGFFSIDFVTFIDPNTMSQVLWAVDLDLQYSSSLSMTQLLYFLTDGKLDTARNCLQVENLVSKPVNPCYRSRKSRLCAEETSTQLAERFSVFSTNLYHTNLGNFNYHVFFQMCKARGIGYDAKRKLGSAVTLVEHAPKEYLGMIVVGESLRSALLVFMSNLAAIHDFISSPSMQGTHNFQGAIADIRTIIQEADINSSLARNVMHTQLSDSGGKADQVTDVCSAEIQLEVDVSSIALDS